MNDLIIRTADFVEDYDEIFGIREEVFIKGQDCPYDEELDGLDGTSEHFLAYLEEMVVGYCRLRMVDKKAKLERFCVYEKWRGKGIGVALVKHLVEFLKTRDVLGKYLYAQTRAKSFYEKLGFKERGEVFQEAGIEHIEMFYKE